MTTCIGCKKEFEVPDPVKGKSEEITCPYCHTKFKVRWKMEPAGASREKQEGRPPAKILVAVDGEATLDIMKEILTHEGHEVFTAGTGKEALSILEKERPAAAYLDVALPQVLGFEICEMVKKSSQLKEIKVILVSSIYDKMRYKREPKSLYGADDYIERHHIHDRLIAKLNRLIYPESPEAVPEETPSAPVVDGLEPVQESLVEVKESGPSGRPAHLDRKGFDAAGPSPAPEGPAGNAGLHEEAKRFARIIVSDIALYNQKAIEEGIENGNVETLLKEELEEAEKLYSGRVSKEIRDHSDYLMDAFRELIERKKNFLKQSK